MNEKRVSSPTSWAVTHIPVCIEKADDSAHALQAAAHSR